MNISIFGLGYVGCVGMGCLASQGHKIIGVDVSNKKVELINMGVPTIVEKDIDKLIMDGHKKGMVCATKDFVNAVHSTDISFICVGTPSSDNGHLDLTYIMKTAEQIGEALKEKRGFHVVVIRSTVFPGTNEKVGQLIADISGKEIDKDFAIVSNPEFLREGTAVNDYLNPPLTVIGSSSEKAVDIMKQVYEWSSAPVEIVPIGVAEMIKYVNNSYHALKVVFANEIGSICKKLNIDSHEVMRIFCMDKQLNISPYYFRPGFAYGGSCLPKDLRGLQTLAHDLYLDTPVLNAISPSNSTLIERQTEAIEKFGKKKIGVLGLSFKAGTDDMRNSPIIHIIESLHGKGFEVKIFDKNVSLSRIIGKNKSVIEERLPHLSTMLIDNIDDVTDWAEVLIIANKDPKFSEIVPTPEQIIVDLVRVKELEKYNNYNGLWW